MKKIFLLFTIFFYFYIPSMQTAQLDEPLPSYSQVTGNNAIFQVTRNNQDQPGCCTICCQETSIVTQSCIEKCSITGCVRCSACVISPVLIPLTFVVGTVIGTLAGEPNAYAKYPINIKKGGENCIASCCFCCCCPCICVLGIATGACFGGIEYVTKLLYFITGKELPERDESTV